MSDLMVPLVPVLIVLFVLIVLVIALGAIVVCAFAFVTQFWTQLTNGLSRRTNLITGTSTDMWIEPGVKEFETDVLFKPGKAGFLKKGKITHADDNKLKNSSAIRWGKRNLALFYWIGKIWPKGVGWMAAQQRVLEIAGLRIDKQGRVHDQLLTLPMTSVQIEGSEKLKAVLDKIGFTKPYRQFVDNDDPESILKYNEYLCLIVGADRKKAADLIQTYVNSGYNEKDEEFLALVGDYVIVPDREKKNEEQIIEAKDQLVEEVKMVCKLCSSVLVPPTVVALQEMMKACPDEAMTDDMLSRIQSWNDRRANAKPNQTDTKSVMTAFVMLELLNVLCFIVIFAIAK